MVNSKAKESNNSRWTEYVVTAEFSGKIIQDILTGPMSISRRMIQKLTRRKGILINKKPAFLKRQVKVGDVIQAKIEFKETASLQPVAMELDIIFEDQDILIINKPAGISVHPVGKDTSATLAHGVANHLVEEGLNTKVRPVHRLDRDTSGLIVFAKTPFAHQFLDQQLRDNSLKRSYLAIIEGSLEEKQGILNFPIARHPQHPTKRTVSAKGETAITNYKVIEEINNISVLELQLETGRTHQIRVHLSHIGHPIIGDRQYGGKTTLGIKRQALHAAKLRLIHPISNNTMELEAPLPEDIALLISILKNN